MIPLFFLLALAAQVFALPKQPSSTAVSIAPTSSGINLPESMPRVEGPGDLTSLRDFFTDKVAITHGGAMDNATSLTARSSPIPGQWPASIMLCQEFNCGGCWVYDLSNTEHDTCLFPAYDGFAYLSVYIDQPNNVGLNFAVLLAQDVCNFSSWIPLVNTCYNLGGPFAEYALRDS